jgi:hypothetical protein
VELAAADEELKLAASQDIVVFETVDATVVTEADMLQLDGQVAREAELTQCSNPEATLQSNGEAVTYANQGSDHFKNLLMRREETHFLLDLQEMMKMPNLRLS